MQDLTPQRSQRSVHRYGEHRDQVGELFLPEGPGPHPVAAVLHGGFWRMRWDRGLMDPVCADLAGRGWAAWNLEYRRVGAPHGAGGWPATFEDVAAGIDALERLDAPLDLGRVTALGHSAGGHLALWAASRPGLPGGAPGAAPRVRPARVVAQAGVTDLVAASRLRLSGAAVHRLLGGSPRRRPERYVLASPAARLPAGLPLLLVHGERDDAVPISMSRAYRDAAVAAGDGVDLVELPEAGHFDHLDPSSEAWAVVTRWLEA